MDAKSKRKPGPEPDHLKIDDDWEDAAKKAVKKERPKEGWPDHENDTKEDEQKEHKGSR